MKLQKYLVILIILLQLLDLAWSTQDEVGESTGVTKKSKKSNHKQSESDPSHNTKKRKKGKKGKHKGRKSKGKKHSSDGHAGDREAETSSGTLSGDVTEQNGGENPMSAAPPGTEAPPTTTPVPLNPWGPTSNGNYTEEGIYIEVMSKPETCQKQSKKGDYVTTEYIGTFPNGAKFDSTYDRKQPMKYRIGDGEVILGCEIATTGMCVGEIRRTIIPSKYAYGDKEYGSIPPGSTLHFEITLVELMEDPFAIFNNFMGG